MNSHKRINELPHADRVSPLKENPWSALKAARGTTPTENDLLTLARSSMLSLWSFPNVHTDEGRHGNGDGKELCDLMVIFGDNVLLFSDKDCTFPSTDDLNVAWNRWYRRAVEKSARQLAGAESWISRFPDRVFLDATCQKKLPISIPPADRRRVHLIAVAHGSHMRAVDHWNSMGPGSSGTLIIDTELVGRKHENQPFKVGWPLDNKRFVHVFDDVTLALVLRELDTVSDLVDYLTKKQQLFENSGCDFLIMGEEELLAAYLTNTDPETSEHRFAQFEPGNLVVLGEGYWKKLEASAEYRSRAEANKISYLWDDLIEYQASHVIHGSSELISGAPSLGSEENENVLRVMASENRVVRRLLGESIRVGRVLASEKRRFTRCIANGSKRRIYAMMALPYFPEQAHSEYREYRQYLLYSYCEGALLQFPDAHEIVGIALEPYNSDIVSVDFIYFRVHDSSVDSAYRKDIEERLCKERMWDPSAISGHIVRDSEFPFNPPLVQRWGRALRRRYRKMFGHSRNRA